MVQRWNGLWLTLAFLSELAALGVLAAWGWQAGSGAGRWLLAAGLPVAAAVLWGAFAAAGINLPHSSRMQSQMGRSVSRSELQPGDLVFFYSPVSHVGIYIGGGQMVHAPTSGDVVKVASVDVMGGYAGARRLAS